MKCLRAEVLRMNISLAELLVVLFIVAILFGAGRISKIFGEVGSGIRAFKEALQTTEETTQEAPSTAESAQRT